jgi:branched-chain amino acid transport system permease protein
MVILGSAGTIIGPVFGAGIFLFFQQFLSDFTDHWMLLFGPLLVLRVIFIREGLWGMLVSVTGAHELKLPVPDHLIEAPTGDAKSGQ